MEELADHIHILREILDQEFCKRTVAKSKDVNWIEASSNKFIYDINDDFDKLYAEMLIKCFVDGINDMLEIYRNIDKDGQIPIIDKSYVFGRGRIVKYHKGAEFHTHFDSKGEMGKAITGIIYLNDDYEGGILNYPYQKIDHKAATGDLIFHPALFTHPHQSSAILSGEKYICVFIATLLECEEDLEFGGY